jgi:iron complex outermembrane receptor protein
VEAERPDPAVTSTGSTPTSRAPAEEHYLEAPSFSVGGACTAANVPPPAASPTPTCVVDDRANNIMTQGTFNDVDLRVENRFDELDTKFTQITLSGRARVHRQAERCRCLAGHSKSDHDNPFQTTLSFDKFNVQGYGYDYTDNRRAPGLTYGSPNLTDPNAWVLRQIRIRPQDRGQHL